MSDMEQSGVKKKKKRLRKGRVFLLLILLIGILCGGFMAGMGLYDRFFSADDPVPKQKENQLLTEEPLSSRINVLLLGKDDGDSEDMNNPDAPKRTDSMMVVSFDPENKQIAIVGLPRDTRVTIPGRRGHDKINAAYAYGGTKRAVRTVEQLLQIPINYYMVVDWQGFIKVIDMLGGVDLYVDNNMDYEDPYANLKIHLKKGYQHLDGEKAGQYVRFRHDELGDIGRVERQQKFMKALAGQFFTFTNMLKLPMIINTGLDYVDTDMNLMTMIRAANCFRIFGENSIKSEMLDGDFKTIDDISYWVTTPSQVSHTLDKLGIPHKRITEI
ncbi:LCP family protein [Acidaminococcus intestini]|uniref:LCP family protein n=1 Tax=Acidaminococcus intestini TaxID=187327 RepID=UPI0024325C46|nr:LCP family protein [Acidaminococcus intestini]